MSLNPPAASFNLYCSGSSIPLTVFTSDEAKTWGRWLMEPTTQSCVLASITIGIAPVKDTKDTNFSSVSAGVDGAGVNT